MELAKEYVVNESGKQVGVLIDIEVYHKVLEDLEELECIRAYDAAKASGDEAIPFGKAIKEIERK
jgi:hypothetical protein